MLLATLLYILLSIGSINAFIPLFIIAILILAAAGATRGFNIFAIFGIATLAGITPSSKGNLSGKSAFPFRTILDPNLRRTVAPASKRSGTGSRGTGVAPTGPSAIPTPPSALSTVVLGASTGPTGIPAPASPSGSPNTFFTRLRSQFSRKYPSGWAVIYNPIRSGVRARRGQRISAAKAEWARRRETSQAFRQATSGFSEGWQSKRAEADLRYFFAVYRPRRRQYLGRLYDRRDRAYQGFMNARTERQRRRYAAKMRRTTGSIEAARSSLEGAEKRALNYHARMWGELENKWERTLEVRDFNREQALLQKQMSAARMAWNNAISSGEDSIAAMHSDRIDQLQRRLTELRHIRLSRTKQFYGRSLSRVVTTGEFEHAELRHGLFPGAQMRIGVSFNPRRAFVIAPMTDAEGKILRETEGPRKGQVILKPTGRIWLEGGEPVAEMNAGGGITRMRLFHYRMRTHSTPLT